MAVGGYERGSSQDPRYVYKRAVSSGKVMVGFMPTGGWIVAFLIVAGSAQISSQQRRRSSRID